MCLSIWRMSNQRHWTPFVIEVQFNQQFQIAASGVTRYGLPKTSIGDAWIPLPDPAEQRSIAAFDVLSKAIYESIPSAEG